MVERKKIAGEGGGDWGGSAGYSGGGKGLPPQSPPGILFPSTI